MSEIKILHNPKCSKSREALKTLQDFGMSIEVIEYLKTPLLEQEILDLLELLPETEIKNLVRTKEALYQEHKFDISNKSEVARNLALYPSLMERPILIKGNKAAIARPLENAISLLKLKRN